MIYGSTLVRSSKNFLTPRTAGNQFAEPPYTLVNMLALPSSNSYPLAPIVCYKHGFGGALNIVTIGLTICSLLSIGSPNSGNQPTSIIFYQWVQILDSVIILLQVKPCCSNRLCKGFVPNDWSTCVFK